MKEQLPDLSYIAETLAKATDYYEELQAPFGLSTGLLSSKQFHRLEGRNKTVRQV